MKTILLLAALFLSTQAFANEASKRAKIVQLAKAQGLEQMFQQQLEQAKASTVAMSGDIVDKMFKDSGLEASPDDPKARQILVRFAEKASMIHTAKEYVDIWSRSYGQEMSEADIDQMLIYYRSPLGRRDMRATQTAMTAFTDVIGKESQVRLSALTENMMNELKATMQK